MIGQMNDQMIDTLSFELRSVWLSYTVMIQRGLHTGLLMRSSRREAGDKRGQIISVYTTEKVRYSNDDVGTGIYWLEAH